MQKERKEYLQSFKRPDIPQLLRLKVDSSICHFHVLHAEKEERIQTKDLSKKALSRRVHAHQVYHMLLYTGGRNRSFLNGTFYPSYRGVLAVSSPGQPHWFGACEPGNISSIEFTFGLEDESNGLFHSLDFHQLLSFITGIALEEINYPVSLEEPQFIRIHSLLESLLDCLNNYDNSRALFDAELTILDVIKFFVQDIYSNYAKDNTDINDAYKGLKQAKLKIEENYSTYIILKDLAKVAKFSTRHFCRMYKEKYGISPINYQHCLRMNTARTLLIATNMRINEIAERVGYGDIYQFSKMFKKHFNISPAIYRKTTPVNSAKKTYLWSNKSGL